MILQLPGYRVTATIYESANTCVFRGVREATGESVIVKVPNTEHPSRKQLARWRYEHEILGGRSLPGVIRCFALESDRGRPALVVEDIGGTSLRRAVPRPVTPAEFLRIAIPLAEAIGSVHDAGIIHKDVNPSNVVVNSASGELRLIDFGIASRLPRESEDARHPSQLEGTLLYLSPEQTGRMNRSVDYRTDFYSLGMTFYELLVGRTAFEASDPLEIVYSQIARAPSRPHDLDPTIPVPISEIVLKLLSKTAESRYQSAFGLLHDLRECARRLREDGVLAPFPIAARDVSRTLQLPQQLFGRDPEVAALLAAFERVSSGGGAETAFVTGYSGIGKSSVVREVNKSIVRRRGYFAAGKADPYRRDVPYDVLAQAFGHLVRQILLEGDTEVAAWKARFTGALGADAPLIASVIPEIERLLGKQPPPPELAPAESRARFEGAFCGLLGATSASGRPLVLFLDDLQWLDAASLQVLRAIVLRPAVRGVLVVGAYRDNEVTPAHPLSIAQDAIEKERPGAIRTLVLRPLTPADVRTYVAEALHGREADVAPLADLLHDKTGGNPFFLNQLLMKLHEDGLVRFQHAEGTWGWDLARIADAPITENVADLMVGRIARLSPAARRVMQIAACVGDRFDLAALASAAGGPARETAAALWEPLREGLILPVSDRYRAPEVYGGDGDGAPTETRVVAYRFLHDRVHQAAHSMMDDAERAKVHAALGRAMARSLRPGARESALFDAVGHFMASGACLDAPGERLEIAGLALLAGKRARGSLAYEAAVSFLRFGIGLLPEGAWSSDYRLTADLHLEALHCEYLAGHSREADALFQTVVGFARTTVEKADAYRARIVLLENASLFAEAMRCGADCLRLFGVELDVDPGDAAVMGLVVEIKALLGARAVSSLLDAPEAKDPETLARAQTLLALTAPAYFLGPRLFASLIAQLVLLSLQKGNTPFSAAGYVFFGVVLASFGDHATGYDFGRLALDLSESLPNPATRGKVEFMFGNWLNFRRHHARTDLDHLAVAFESCLAAGDRTYATYCCIGFVQLWFALGKNVLEAHAEAPRWMGFVEEVKALDIVDNIRTVNRAFMCLAGLTRGPHTYDDDQGFVEADFERHLNEMRSPPVQAYFYHHRSVVRFVHEDFAGALADTRESEKRQGATSGQHIAEEHPFHQSLILAATYADAGEAERAETRALLDRNHARLSAIAVHAPMNYAHKVALMEAERARLDGDAARATELYDRAIELALANGYPHHAALANECAARFYLAGQRTTLARAYLTEAYHGYVAWGAAAKVRLLAERHRRLISDLVVEGARASAIGGLTTTGTTLGGTYALDVLSVAKASQAISREIQLDQLLAQLVRILLENAGAERGVLLLRGGRDGREWVIEAAGDVKGVQVLRSIPIDGSVLPKAMIDYVARAGEAVVLDDASSHDVYGRDPYVTRHHVKSVACLPAVNTGNLVAIVYLENNLSEAAFSANRLEVLGFLSTQIAISIDNARLYAGLEEKVRDRTAELERTQAHLRVLERLETERLMAGGFAHELRNALAGPTALIAEILGLGDRQAQISIPLANATRLGEVLALFAPTATSEQLASLRGILRDVLAADERLEKMLQVAHGSVTRALGITQEILDYARVGNERAEPTLVDVNDVVRGLVRELDYELAKQQVRLEARLDPAVARVRCHEAQLHSVIKNLVLNARDASLSGASARAEHVIVVATETGDGRALVSVADQGIGIAPEDLGRIFEPFFSTKPESGIGLGLAVAKKIVALAGGALTVASTLGEGTRFQVALPAAASLA